MFVCSTQVRRETLGLIGVCFSKVWLSFYSCGLPLNGSASPFTTKIGGNIQAAQISPHYVAVEPCYVAPWPDCVGGFVWVGRIFFFLEGGVGAPPPPLPHLPSLHHPKIWIFFFFFQIPFFFFFFLKNPKTRKPGFENPETRPNLTPGMGVRMYFVCISCIFALSTNIFLKSLRGAEKGGFSLDMCAYTKHTVYLSKISSFLCSSYSRPLFQFMLLSVLSPPPPEHFR